MLLKNGEYQKDECKFFARKIELRVLSKLVICGYCHAIRQNHWIKDIEVIRIWRHKLNELIKPINLVRNLSGR